MPNALQLIAQLKTMAGENAINDFQALLDKRLKEGFKALIMDLKEQSEQGAGWELKNGFLTVQTQHDTRSLMEMLDRRLGSYSWFQPSSVLEDMKRRGVPLPKPQLPEGFDAFPEEFKVLGKFFANPAMDVVLFLKTSNGSLNLQHIVRFDKSLAFVGGIIEDGHAVLDKCVQETLEEFYSKRLFTKNSASLNAVDTLTTEAIQGALLRALNEKEFGGIKTLKDELLATFKSSDNFFNKIERLEQIIKTKGLTIDKIPATQTKPAVKMTIEELRVYLVRIKCRLYQYALPKQYIAMTEFILGNLKQLPKTVVEGDPRGTNSAWMDTIPHYVVIDEDNFLAQQTSWCVEAEGGDDALSAKCTPIDKLFDEAKQIMYASHARILLECLVAACKDDPALLASAALQQQVDAIAHKIRARTEARLRVVREGTVVLQQGPRGNVLLAPGSDAGAVQFASTVGLSVAEVVEDSTQRAQERLKRLVSPVRYARMQGYFEEHELPLSALNAVLALKERGKVNIVVDNSGSMTNTFAQEPNASGALVDVTRWQEAQRRLNALLQLLALIGVTVEIQTINPIPGTQGLRFDFASATTIEAMERLRDSALRELQTKIFDSTPNNGTDVLPALSYFFDARQPGRLGTTLLISDGIVDSVEKVKTLLKTRNGNNFQACPFIVVACEQRNDSDRIDSAVAWAKSLRDEKTFCVAIMKDFATQEAEFRAHQGESLKYNEGMWSLLHLTAAYTPGCDHDAFGLYHFYDGKVPYQQEEIARMLGVNIDDLTHQKYLRGYQAAKNLRESVVPVVMAQAVGGYTPAYAALGATPPQPAPGAPAPRAAPGWGR